MVKHKRVWMAGVVSVLAGCGGPLKYQATSSGKAPGADASIQADVQEEQHQTALRIEIEHLPPASRVDPASSHYVAWYRRNDKEIWKRLAGLQYEEGSREGTLVTAVPETKFELWVTTETGVDVVSPSPNVVFTQRVGG